MNEGTVFLTIRMGGAEIEANLPIGVELHVQQTGGKLDVSASAVNPASQPAAVRVAAKPE